jgi:hypothetical protein
MDVRPSRLPHEAVEAVEACSHIRDRLVPMLNAEEIVLAQSDHLELASVERGCAPNSLWREKVSLWMFEVADHMHERRSIVYFAMNILDRYCITSLKKGSCMCESSYEKASLAAVFLALRIAGSTDVELSDIIRMSRRGIDSQQLIQSGNDMVKNLTWENRLVAPQEFISALVAYLPSAEGHAAILDGAFYLSELAVCDAWLAPYKASDIALAAFLNTVVADRGGDACRTIKSIQESTPMNPDSDTIREVRVRLHQLYSLSYDSIDKGIPHVISSDDEADCPRGFMSSCATRSISNEDLIALNVDEEVLMMTSANTFPNCR